MLGSGVATMLNINSIAWCQQSLSPHELSELLFLIMVMLG